MNDLIREIENADSIAITGHINPDGDCIGSTLGMYNYITSNYPDKRFRYIFRNSQMYLCS